MCSDLILMEVGGGGRGRWAGMNPRQMESGSLSQLSGGGGGGCDVVVVGGCRAYLIHTHTHTPPAYPHFPPTPSSHPALTPPIIFCTHTPLS